MSVFKKKSWLENLFVLVLISVFAGATAGLAVGFVTGRSPSTTSAAH